METSPTPESHTLSWAHLRVCSSLWRTSTSNAAKAELLKSSRTQITPITVSSFYCHLASASGAWWQKLRDLGGASPPGHQAPKLKLGLITSTWLHLTISKIFIILHHPYSWYVYTLYNLFAHSCLYSYLLRLQYTVLHILFYYSYFFPYLYLCIFSCVYIPYNCTFHGADLTFNSLLIIVYVTNKILNWIIDHFASWPHLHLGGALFY